MSQADSTTSIHFQGSPRNLQGLVSVAFQEVVSGGLPRLELASPPPKAGTESHTLQTESAGALATWLRFALPEAWPPGTYKGTVLIRDAQYPSVIEVRPHLALSISPRRLTLQGASCAELSATLIVVNTGNVTFEIARTYKVGLLDVKGAERAVGIALREHETPGLMRVNLFADEMARSHGGRLLLTIGAGDGALAPGEFRNLSITIRLPDGLKGGRIYAGEWMLLNRSYPIEVMVVDAAPAQGER